MPRDSEQFTTPLWLAAGITAIALASSYVLLQDDPVELEYQLSDRHRELLSKESLTAEELEELRRESERTEKALLDEYERRFQ